MPKSSFKAREAVNRFRTDEDGVVSFEYIIVACLVMAIVGAA